MGERKGSICNYKPKNIDVIILEDRITIQNLNLNLPHLIASY